MNGTRYPRPLAELAVGWYADAVIQNGTVDDVLAVLDDDDVYARSEIVCEVIEHAEHRCGSVPVGWWDDVAGLLDGLADRLRVLDTASSASRQHYIDTGRYLTREESSCE